MVEVRQTGLTRQLLGKFLSDPQTIKAFENLSLNSDDLATAISEIQQAAVLVLSLTDAFENERVASSDGEVQLTDGGPGGNLTFGLSNTGVTAAVYGSATQTVQFTVNAKGRISLAQAHALNSDNVTEGAANLYFTNARARLALSSGVGMAYNSTTGAIDAGAVLAAYAGGDTPSAFTLGIVDSVDGAAWRTAIGAGTSTVTPSALTKSDDTNVTLTLGGSPSTALIAATSLTLGWTGTLAVARGGIGTGTASGTALDNITAFSGTGHLVRTGAGSYAFRALTAPAAGITVSNGSGVSGNPTLALADDLAALEALTGTDTIYRRSGVSTWTAVTIGSSLSFSGGTLDAAQTLASGTYTPTLTGVANITGSTSYTAQYLRVGNIVTVSGKIDIQATAATTNTRIGISLPIASNFANAYEAGGTGAPFGANSAGPIYADATNDRAEFAYISADTNNRGFNFSFTYRVI